MELESQIVGNVMNILIKVNFERIHFYPSVHNIATTVTQYLKNRLTANYYFNDRKHSDIHMSTRLFFKLDISVTSVVF